MATQPSILTYADVIDAAMDFLGGNSTSAGIADIRRCIQTAYREVSMAREWSFLREPGRIQLKAEESTGTITYDHTGGATYERQLTLAAGNTWPSWAADAHVQIGDAIHAVQTRHSGDQILQLDPVMNPGADVDAGTSFKIFPMWYELPADFVSFSTPYAEGIWQLGESNSDEEMMALHRYRHQTGTIRYHCVRSLPELHGSYGLYVYPAADADETLDFIYNRSPRQLRYSGHTAARDRVGTAAVDATQLIVTGTDTAFYSLMEGSLIRFGDTTYDPTGMDGLHPFLSQQTIATVTDTTHVTLASALGAQPGAGTHYVVSDVIDLDAVVHEAFMACVRKHLAIQRNMKRKEDFLGLYQEALRRAKSADNRDDQPQVMGPRQPQVMRLKDMIDV